MKKQALIFLAEGFEEVEALTVVDLLRRAEIEIKMVSITGDKKVTGSHGIAVEADVLFAEADVTESDAYILPGGMPGTRNLEACAPLIDVLNQANEKGKLLCAICAAPLVLGVNHLLEGKKASCYPGFEKDLRGALVSYNPVSKQDNVITSRGMGTAISFAAEIIKTLLNEKTAEEIKESIIYK